MITATVGRDDSRKNAVRVATVGTITIATDLNPGDTLDGVTLVLGDRVLVKDQADDTENGVYIVSSTPSRAPDLDNGTPFLESGIDLKVKLGTVNTRTGWILEATDPIVIGTTSINWVLVFSAALSVEGTLCIVHLIDKDFTVPTGQTCLGSRSETASGTTLTIETGGIFLALA